MTVCDITLTFFIYLNQQFITWGIVAVYGSYFITMYIGTNYKKTKIKEKEKEKFK